MHNVHDCVFTAEILPTTATTLLPTSAAASTFRTSRKADITTGRINNMLKLGL